MLKALEDVLTKPLQEQGEDPLKLEVRGVAKHYDAVVALEPTDLTLRQGEFLTLLGPSGSGKTTLLMMIAGLTEPSAGEILIDGRVATDLPPHARDIGMVFQNYALFPHMSVAENVSFPLEMRGWSRARREDAVRQALDQVQLGHLADRSPARLSGGQQQRVALARALVYEPSIVLMDEPLGALDKKLRDHMQLEIRRLHRDLGITVVYVTHDQDEAMSLSDRICLMNNARVEQMDAPRALYDHPNTLFAANFLGESNLIQVTILGRENNATICRAADGTVLRAAAGAAVSGPATLVLRPERCRLLSSGRAGGDPVYGRVDDVVMLGAVTRITVATAIGSLVVVALSGPDTNISEGDRVAVCWDAEAGTCIPGEVP